MSAPKINSKVIVDGDMSSDLISTVVDVSTSDTASIQLVWTGVPTGAFFVQGSLDYRGPDTSGTRINPPVSGTWTSLTLDPAPVAIGAAGDWLIDLQSLSFPAIRVIYTFTGGTGTLQALVFSKVCFM
jgi:hypothetical protein